MNKAIEKRQNKEKGILLEQLKKTPIVQIACEKSGIGRATYYRWRKEDLEFTKMADEALQEGSLLVNDMAESQLISSIRNNNLGAILFWLRNHHPAYLTKVEITSGNKADENLTAEQQDSVKKSLVMAGLLLPSEIKKEKDE